MNVACCIRATSHIVEFDARAKFHSLPKALDFPIAHNVEMDKNGGPNYLKAWREHRELSQEALGGLVGTTGTVISMLESGDRGLSAKWLRKLAKVLDVKPGYILDHDPKKIDADIIDIWMHAKPDQRRQIIDVAKALVKSDAV
jgi:transcriptional regulator with XRE-family HTH domain